MGSGQQSLYGNICNHQSGSFPGIIYPRIRSNYELLPCCSFLNRILPWTFAIFLDQSFLGPYQLLYSFFNLLGLDCDFNADTWSFRLDLRESSSSFYKYKDTFLRWRSSHICHGPSPNMKCAKFCTIVQTFFFKAIIICTIRHFSGS